MESLKRSLIRFAIGAGIWYVLYLLHVRSGEAVLNAVKIILDIFLAAMLVDRDIIKQGIALAGAIAVTWITFEQIPAVAEFFLLIAVVIIGVALRKEAEAAFAGLGPDGDGSADGGPAGMAPGSWYGRNFFNPFETYSYSPDGGISISKGIIRRSYISIPTTMTRVRIHQSMPQRVLGLCNVFFQSSYTGQPYGEDYLKNVQFQSAMELMQMLQ